MTAFALAGRAAVVAPLGSHPSPACRERKTPVRLIRLTSTDRAPIAIDHTLCGFRFHTTRSTVSGRRYRPITPHAQRTMSKTSRIAEPISARIRWRCRNSTAACSSMKYRPFVGQQKSPGGFRGTMQPFRRSEGRLRMALTKPRGQDGRDDEHNRSFGLGTGCGEKRLRRA